MIHLHATKKLMAKLTLDEYGYLPETPRQAHLWDNVARMGSPSALGSWHANILTIQRRNCLLFVHDQTRFPLFMPALKKADLDNLDWWFNNTLMNTLLKCNATEVQMNKVAQYVQPLQVDTVCDRSVQGSMNQMAQEVEHTVYYNEVNIAEITGYRVGAVLADVPRSVKGYKHGLWPVREFLALIDALPLTDPAPLCNVKAKPSDTTPSNVVSLAQFRDNRSQ